MSIVGGEREDIEKMIPTLEKHFQLSRLTSIAKSAISSTEYSKLLQDHMIEIEFAYNILCKYSDIEILYEDPIVVSGREFTPDFQVKYKNEHYFFQMKTASQIVDYNGKKHRKITTEDLRKEGGDFVCFDNIHQLDGAIQNAVEFLDGLQLSSNTFVYILISDISRVYEISMLEDYLYGNCLLPHEDGDDDGIGHPFFETKNGKKVNGVIYKLRNDDCHLFLNPASANMDNSIGKLVDIAEIHRGVDR